MKGDFESNLMVGSAGGVKVGGADGKNQHTSSRHFECVVTEWICGGIVPVQPSMWTVVFRHQLEAALRTDGTCLRKIFCLC